MRRRRMWDGVHKIDQAQMDWLFNINFLGLVHATRASCASGQTARAHIVNLSRLGIIAPPPDRLQRRQIRGARIFGSLRHELGDGNQPGAAVGGASRGVSTAVRTRAPASASPTTPAAPIDRPFDAVARTTPTAAALRIIEASRTTRRGF